MIKIENVNQAITVLIQAAQLGQQHGSYSLPEASLIQMAIDYLVPEQEMPEPEEEVISSDTIEPEEEVIEDLQKPSYVKDM